MRVGIYGGSFNPVHNGHLRTVEEVREAAALDEIWLVPANLPPHKNPREIAPATDRLKMLELAIRGADRIRVDSIELERPGLCYTIDTLRALRARSAAVDFKLVLGIDAFREIHTWYQYEKLLAECDLIVTTRPPRMLDEAGRDRLLGELPIAVARSFCYDSIAQCYRHRSGHRLDLLRVTQLDISSSDIRSRLRTGRSIHFLTPPDVVEYIRQLGLYGVAESPAVPPDSEHARNPSGE